MRHEAVGLNYIDVYFRTGLYKTALPATPGMEGAGIVIGVGSGVTTVKEGDRVAYAGGPLGAYASERVIAGRPPRHPARWDRLQDGGGDDAAGYDRAISPAPHLPS